MALSIKNLDRICLLVVIVVTALGGFWVVRDGLRQRTVVQQKLELLSKRMDDLTLADASLQPLRALVAEKKGELQALNELIPDSAGIGKLIKQMDGLIKVRDIDLLSIQPQAMVKNSSYTRTPIQIMLTGSFENAYYFLQDLEGVDRLIDVQKLLIAKSGDSGNCSIDLTANVYER